MKNRKRDSVPSGDDEGDYTSEFKASLRRSVFDLESGRTHSLSKVMENIYKK